MSSTTPSKTYFRCPPGTRDWVSGGRVDLDTHGPWREGVQDGQEDQRARCRHKGDKEAGPERDSFDPARPREGDLDRIVLSRTGHSRSHW